MGYFDSLRRIDKTKNTAEKNDERSWDDLNTDLSLDEDATEEWGPDYPKEDE